MVGLNFPMESGMSHQDTDGHNGSAPQHQALKQALDWLLNPAPLSAVRFREECTWTPKALVFAAILWAWSDEKTLTDRFAVGRKIVIAMAWLPRRPAKSYQAFLKMLKTWTVVLTIALQAAFRRRMQADLAERFTVHGFQVFGVDGSRLELPRTASHEQRFSPPSARREKRPGTKHRRRARSKTARAERARQKKINSPQMWLTTMFHAGTGLPWDWRTGPSHSSEREHFRQMIDALPAAALVTADAGFAGYDYWKALIESRRHLLIRVGANVRLLRKLGYARENRGVVYLWPDREAARNQPPLVLRLVVAQGGRHPVYLVTSVRDQTALSDRQVAGIYSLRWGVELFYRHFKQTFERRKLRSHAADNAESEATWSLLGLWAMALHAEVQLAREGVSARRMSVAKILSAYRKSMREYKSGPDPGESLAELVSKALIDPYKRADKSSRDYPRKKHGHAIGAPQIRNATKDQIKTARQIRDQRALGLTA
jgi:Transposase DDE domain